MKHVTSRAMMCIAPLVLSGCSVFMAANTSRQPDLGVLHAGVTRAQVEEVLGPPITPLRENVPGDVQTYQFFTEEGKSYGRAALYGALDVATLGLAELATTPIEALQGDKHVVEVRYDVHGRVVSHSVVIEMAPLQKPEKMIGLEAQDRS